MDQPNGLVQRPRSSPFEAYGKVLNFDIILDRKDGPNGVGVYSPGETLTGHVRLELAQRLTVNNIDLLVQGTGNVAWKLRGPQGEELVSDDEVYINDIAELVHKKVNEMVTLSAGEHIFPFACDLPWELPATFTGSHGNVSYLVKVVIQADRNEPAHREPCIATNIFLLESRLSMEGMGEHLNSYRIDYKHPVKSSALTTGSSSIKVSLFMPRRAYDIGDNIVVNMSLTNTSKRAVRSMSLALVMEATYRVRDRTASERLLVVDHDDEFVVRHLESRQWRHVGLSVPRCIPPSGLPHSTLIGIKYWLVFKAELERSEESVLLQTPVLIGLELPDEMKLSAAAYDGSFTEAAQQADDTASGRPSTSRILYQGSQEPSYSEPATPTSSAALQRPLYVDVQRVERQQSQPQKQAQQQHLLQPPMPQSHYQPVRHQQQQQHLQQPPPQGSPRGEADSQVISMRFTDELEDHHSPYGQPYHRQQESQQHHQQPQSKMSRNPLFVPDADDANGYHEGTHERRLGGGGGVGVGVTHGNGGERGTRALDASLGNGAEEVLY